MGFFRREPKSLKDAIKHYIDDIPQRKKLKKGMILSLWPRVVGKAIAEQTENIHFEDDKLVMNVKNSAWRHEIHMSRYTIAKKLNNEVKERIVKEIIVRS